MGAALPFIAIAATVIGGISKANADESAAAAQAQASQYQAGVALQNQQISSQYAAMETARGEQLAQQKEMETAQRQGAIVAATGASGLDPGSGSALRLSDDTLAMGRLDASTIRYNASKAAYGYKVQGMNYANQANLDMLTAENASKAGNTAAFSDIIAAGGQVGSKWAAFKTVGATGVD